MSLALDTRSSQSARSLVLDPPVVAPKPAPRVAPRTRTRAKPRLRFGVVVALGAVAFAVSFVALSVFGGAFAEKQRRQNQLESGRITLATKQTAILKRKLERLSNMQQVEKYAHRSGMTLPADPLPPTARPSLAARL